MSIIGGPDGPTVFFVTGSLILPPVLLALAAALAGTAVLLFLRKRKK